MTRFRVGETCYFVENGLRIVEATIIAIESDFYVIRYGIGGIRLRGTRLYKSPEEAEKHTRILIRHRTPYNYEK